MVNTFAWNARDMGLPPTLGTIFPIFITPMTLLAVSRIVYELCTVWL